MESDLTKCQCLKCPLAKAGKPFHKPVKGYGPDKPKLVIVGEAPGKDEIFEGKPFVGPTGQVVEALIEGIGLTREEVYLTNTTLCTPLDGGKASNAAIEACKPRLMAEVANAPLVVSLGSYAVRALMDTKLGITQLEGAVYTLKDGTKLLPTFHPAAALRGRDDYFDNIQEAFERAQMILNGHKIEEIDISKFQYNYHTPERALDALTAIKAKLEQRGELRIALDLETRSTRYMIDPILQVGMFDGEEIYVIEYGGRVRKMDGTYEPEDFPGWKDEAKQLFAELLDDKRIEWVLHNQKFDFQFTQYNFGAEPRVSRDTMCWALGLTEQQSRVGLDVLARRWFNARPYWEELEQWLPKTKSKRQYDMIPRPVLAKYLAHDVVYTWHLLVPLQEECKRQGTEKLPPMLERYQWLFSRMEYRGCNVDLEYVAELRKIWYPVVDQALKDLQEAAKAVGFDARKVVKAKNASRLLKPSSPKQLMHLFFDIMKLRPVYNQKRKLTTDKEFIKRNEDNPVVQKLQAYRTVKKMMSTYVDGVHKFVWPDKKIHPDILVFGTRTGRLAIKRPPIQTIPKEKRLKIKFNSLRKLFCVEWPEWVMVEVDYSQLEMRIAWHYSQDPLLGEALMSGDFHKFMASKMFRVPMDQVTDKQRDASKFVTFGILYGRQAFSIAESLGISVNEAQALIDFFFQLAPGMHKWWKDTIAHALAKQEGRTTLGRVRRWPLITPKNLQEVKNQAVNFPIQSLASDLNTLSAVTLEHELWEVRRWGFPLFVVHDATYFQVKREHFHPAVQLIKDVMTTPPFETCARFDVDVKWGKNWGEMNDYTGTEILHGA